MSTGPSWLGDRKLRRQAAAWLAKHDRGLTAAEQDAFLQWLAADERHRRWFSRHRSGWLRLDGLADWRPRHSPQPNPDVLARPLSGMRWMRPIALAAAAGVALVLGGSSWMREKWPASMAEGAAVAATSQRRLLNDGSAVQLKEGTEAEVVYSATRRAVVLRRGEALFSVAKDPQRPFVVSVGGVDVRAIGTVFNVRLENDSVEVLVTEGKVQLASPGGGENPRVVEATPSLVVAGQRAVVPFLGDSRPQIVQASAAELSRLRDWQPELLDFSSTPLINVIAEFNRRNRVQLRLADPSSGSLAVVGSIRSDNVEGFVQFLGLVAGLRPEFRSESEIVLHPNG